MMAEDITLRDYMDVRIKSVEDRIDALSDYTKQHFSLNEQAIKKAEEAMLIRLEGMNQFREQILSEREAFATKDGMENRLKALEMSNAFSSGKLWMVMALFAIIPTALALVALFVR